MTTNQEPDKLEWVRYKHTKVYVFVCVCEASVREAEAHRESAQSKVPAA